MPEQVIFDGLATFDDLGLHLLEGVELPPPEPKTVLVDIPGGDGSVDLSEVSGDVRYGDREFVFPFLLKGRTPDGIQAEATDLMRRLHGRRLPFQLSWDPGYTYTGRVVLEEFEHMHGHATIRAKVLTAPYKHAGTQTWRVNAAGGVEVVIPNGRRRWSPTFEVEREALVSHGGRGWTIPPGASTISELWLEPGDNVLILNTDPGYGAVMWTDVGAQTWDELEDTRGRWYAVAAGDSPRQVPVEWEELDGTWAPNGSRRWVELMHPEDADATYTAYIQTEIYDL